MISRWRPIEVIGEAARNVRAMPVGALLLVAVVALTVGAGTIVEANEARRARTELAARATDGGWVTVARSSRGIDARSCRRLAHQPEVLAAGGVDKPTSVALTAAPGTLFEAYHATPEFLDVLAARAGTMTLAGQVGVGPSLARELGLVDGSRIVVLGAPTPLSVVVLPVSFRAERFSRALVVPAPTERVEECWVEWRAGTGDVRLLTEALLAVDTPLTVSAMLTTSASARDPFVSYAQRWTQWWFVAGGLVVALVTAISLRTRSRPRALYLAVGTSRTELAALYGIEASFLATLGTAAGSAWGLALFATRGGEVTTSDVATALGEAVFVPACLVLVTVLMVTLRPVDLAAGLKAE